MAYAFRVKNALVDVRGDRAYASLRGARYEYHDNNAPQGHKRVAWLYMADPAQYARDCQALGCPASALPYFIAAKHLHVHPERLTFTLATREFAQTAGGGYRVEPREKLVTFVRLH